VWSRETGRGCNSGLRPRAEAFLSDITQIAEAFGIDRAAFGGRSFRRVDAIEVVRTREQPGQPAVCSQPARANGSVRPPTRRSLAMNNAELEKRAGDFWADTDLGDVYPRSIEQAIA